MLSLNDEGLDSYTSALSCSHVSLLNAEEEEREAKGER